MESVAGHRQTGDFYFGTIGAFSSGTDSLPVGTIDNVYRDRELPGFGVRVYPSGSRMYLVQTRASGKSRRITVGRHGVVSADQARRKAAQMIARIKAGEDPEPPPVNSAD